ncbi:PfkB family carbohydrate kinase [Arcanobacterium pinnipediorum]|uniref:PfkB family carbohydrate kinase n=1 Tax=Arcanobacterium pinnipediorum TaxID=1503041 RepID=A0ABY5AGV2_9ACTO|nr:PfkB family carbohydrate kinase [Arcanobacterium pinnipediorum]USR78941.1 PfkB family carbohydrate kinase [Arcanobacterium pinnipediorum]
MPELIHTGSIVVDMVMTIDTVPTPGNEVLATTTHLVAGGGLNSMLAAQRGGLPVKFAGLVGTGPFGDIIVQALTENELASIYPRVASKDSGFCVALVDKGGERTFITQVGAESDVSFKHLSQITINDGDLVYVSGYSLAATTNAEGLVRWLGTVPDSTVVFFDPSPLVCQLPEKVFQPLIARASIVSCNLREAQHITGQTRAKDCASRLAELLRPRAHAIVRAGKEPTLISSADDPHSVISVPTFPVDAVDTNGAGDTHAGVVLSSIAQGLSLEQSVRRANAAAAISVTRSGPASAPTADEVDEFLAEHR